MPAVRKNRFEREYHLDSQDPTWVFYSLLLHFLLWGLPGVVVSICEHSMEGTEAGGSQQV